MTLADDAKGKAGGVKEAVTDEARETEGRLDQAVGKAKDIAEEVRDAAGHLIERAREEIAEHRPDSTGKLDQAVAKAKDIAEEVRDAAGHLIERAREEIAEHRPGSSSDSPEPIAAPAQSRARPATKTRKAKAKASVWTIPHGDGWANKREGATRVAKVFPTKAAAQAAGRNTAQREKVEHIVFKRDGEIGERNTYGNDPVRPTA